MAKKVILFDIRTCERKLMTYEEISAFTGSPCSSLYKLKQRRTRIRSINCYVLPHDAAIEVYKEILSMHPVLKGEVWLPYDGYLLSNYGRVKNKDGVFKLSSISSGNMAIKLHTRPCNLSRIVYEVFVGEIKEGHCIVHKNGNNKDCAADNLLQVERKDKNKYYLNSKAKAVVRVHVATGEVEYFETVKEAQKESMVATSSMTRILKTGKPLYGYKFYYEKDYKGEYI